MGQNLLGEGISKQMELLIKYEGTEFNNFVNLTHLNKRLGAIDKVIKHSINSLIDTKTIKVSNDKKLIEDIKIDIQRGSLIHTILVEFASQTTIDYLGNLIVDYLKYLAGKEIGERLTPALINHLNLNFSALNQYLSLIHLGNNVTNNVTIEYKENVFIIDNEKYMKIKRTVNELKENLHTEEIEKTQIVIILDMNLDGKEIYKMKLNSGELVPIEFVEPMDFEEIRPLLNHKLVVECISNYERGIIKDILIKEYKLARKPTIKDY